MSKSVNENAMKLNRIKPGTNVLFNILFVILALMCFVPIILIFVISLQTTASSGSRVTSSSSGEIRCPFPLMSTYGPSAPPS